MNACVLCFLVGISGLVHSLDAARIARSVARCLLPGQECLNNGTCLRVTVPTGVCGCLDGWKGARCQDFEAQHDFDTHRDLTEQGDLTIVNAGNHDLYGGISYTDEFTLTHKYVAFDGNPACLGFKFKTQTGDAKLEIYWNLILNIHQSIWNSKDSEYTNNKWHFIQMIVKPSRHSVFVIKGSANGGALAIDNIKITSGECITIAK